VSEPRRVVVVTGLSGAGKSSILRTLEDAGYEAVDNPPLSLVGELVSRGGARLAIGIDARTSGFDASAVLATLAALRQEEGLRAELIYASADEAVLLRRYTETRRRHPLAPQGRVVDGIAAEQRATDPLREAADLVIDTSEMPLRDLREMVEQHFAPRGADGVETGLTVSLISFAYPAGLPREADLVFDARFLRNPHYDPLLRPLTGTNPDVGAYVEADPDCAAFFRAITGLLALVLPRFVQEGKKYATIAIGCTGGRHRSVYLIEKLGAHLAAPEGGKWRVTVTHRELARQEASRPAPATRALAASVQAQEA
jgi:RNase adapter protein RapZ